MTEEALPPGVREVIAGVVDAVGAGEDAGFDRLLEQLVRSAGPMRAYELHRQLAKGCGSP
ncbi:hypothetical protein C6N75_08395 [Streptomyces solincola]|uniref:Uncharacterized protein n=1 Tax=Streptomyces solincola TaxID=2100817 RepID=A0A2S9PZ21_9ACTN|nr:hypothetical protein [Streptomyces solincola]PRH79648.1 hypothetical protein C6N75_08395 [Streptomyces solincola]